MRISPAMTKRSVAALLTFAAVGLWSTVAVAGPLGITPHAINSDGPDEGYWRGSVEFHALDTVMGSGNEVQAVFDWAVFAPGKFQDFLDDHGIPATDPAPGEVVYAYQVREVTIANPGIHPVTVDIDFADPVTTNPPLQVLTGWAGEQAMTPPASLPGHESAKWRFDGGLITAGEISPLLVIASPNAPQLATFTVTSGMASFTGRTPETMVGSPGSEEFVIPEPASIVLLMVGIAGLCLSYRRAD